MKLRVGRVKFAWFNEKQDAIDNYHEVVSLLKFIPLRAEYMFFGKCIEMEGISPLFDECPQAAIAPLYEIIVHTVEGKVDSIEAKKIEG